MENLSLGLMLMAIGMITVFAILLIVINLSKLLIAVVNKVAPEEVVAKKIVNTQTPSSAIIDPNTMAAIKGAVNIVTGGKGKVMTVEKI
jgi:oxaloacetate decarboxylase gamma subunit